jgi:hypothetical protein
MQMLILKTGGIHNYHYVLKDKFRSQLLSYTFLQFHQTKYFNLIN